MCAAINMVQGNKLSLVTDGLTVKQIRKANELKHDLMAFMEENNIQNPCDINQFIFNEWLAVKYPPIEVMKQASNAEKLSMGMGADTNLIQLF